MTKPTISRRGRPMTGRGKGAPRTHNRWTPMEYARLKTVADEEGLSVPLLVRVWALQALRQCEGSKDVHLVQVKGRQGSAIPLPAPLSPTGQEKVASLTHSRTVVGRNVPILTTAMEAIDSAMGKMESRFPNQDTTGEELAQVLAGSNQVDEMMIESPRPPTARSQARALIKDDDPDLKEMLAALAGDMTEELVQEAIESAPPREAALLKGNFGTPGRNPKKSSTLPQGWASRTDLPEVPLPRPPQTGDEKDASTITSITPKITRKREDIW